MNMVWALLAGCGIALLQICVDTIPVLQYLEVSDTQNFPLTVFEKCLSLIQGSMFPVYYFLFIPMIAALPYGMVMYKDRKQGYIKNVFTRTKRSNYYVAQYVTAFVSAGVVAVIPQILNVLVTALMLPSVFPYPGIGYVGIWGENLWSDIYYKNPYLYLGLYWLLDFAFYGLLNTLALSVSWLLRSRFSVLMVPFLTIQGLELMMLFVGKPAWMPESFLRPAQPMLGTSLMEIIILMVFMLLFAIVSVIYGIRRKDYYE